MLSLRSTFPAGFALAAVAAAAVAACSSTKDPAARPGGDTPDASADAATLVDAAGARGAEQLFRALEPELVQTCGGNGGACHVRGAVGGAGTWLGPPDAYKSAKAWRGVVPDDNILDHCILLTQIEHTGPSLVASPALYAKVKEWVAAEIVGTRLPGSEPFLVTAGANVVDLGKVAPGAEGAKLRFEAQITGDILTLAQIKIVGATQKTLRVESPFFAILPEKGPVISDTTFGFAGPLEVGVGETKDFYGGALVVPRWKATTRLQLFFFQMRAADPPDGGAPGGCRSVATFTQSAVPAFKLDLGGGVTCLGCHGGANDVATNAMDLSKVDSDNAAACAQARNHVNLTDKAKSPLITTPTGAPEGNPNHAVRTAGADYVNAIRGWIDNE